MEVITSATSSSLSKARDKFIDEVSRMGDAFGMNRFVIQLYAYLYITGRPVSLDEITEALGVSKGSVSVNIRELEKWGAVRNIWVKGSRKDYYEAEPDIKKVLAIKIKSAIGKKIGELSAIMGDFNCVLKSFDGDLTDEEKTQIKVYEEKIKKIEELRNLASTALSVADKIL